MTCAWTEPLGTVVWCDDQTCIHNHVGMCAMDTVDLIGNKCKTKEEFENEHGLSDHKSKAR